MDKIEDRTSHNQVSLMRIALQKERRRYLPVVQVSVEQLKDLRSSDDDDDGIEIVTDREYRICLVCMYFLCTSNTKSNPGLKLFTALIVQYQSHINVANNYSSIVCLHHLVI